MSIYKRVRNGKSSKYYYFKFEYQGKTVRQCAETGDKYEAMAREREARTHAREGRWADIRRMGMRRSSGTAKLAQVLTVYRALASVNPDTIRQNIACLKTICSKLYPETPIEDLSVHVLTAHLVREYKATVLAAAGQNKVALESARTTANSTYAQARSIFNDQMLACYQDAQLDVGETIAEFRTVPLFEVARRQYKRPSLDLLVKLLKMAFAGEGETKSLRDTDPNAYKAFLLCLGLGLRKNAAGHARYTWITEQKSAPIAQLMLAFRSQAVAATAPAVFSSSTSSEEPKMNIGDTPPTPSPTVPAPVPAAEKVQRVLMTQIEEDFQPKGRDEICIPMDEFVHAELEALKIPPSDPAAPAYILHGTATERKELVWRRLASWMKGLGWERRMKAHELRKLYGAEVASAFGLYAAQKLLGHKDANLTSSRYADINQLPDVRIFG